MWPLEIFHSALLKYLPKRQAFSYDGMRERCYLAILEHNENIVKRKQATTVTGEPRFKQVYCKKTKQWILKTIFTPHTTHFIGHLIKRVMDRRHDLNIEFKPPHSPCHNLLCHPTLSLYLNHQRRLPQLCFKAASETSSHSTQLHLSLL